MPCTRHVVKYRIVQKVSPSLTGQLKSSHTNPTTAAAPLYLPPNQLETPLFAWLAFSSTFLSILSISWMVAFLASLA